MDEFLDSVKTPILNQEVNNLNRPLANEEIETVIKCLPDEESPRARWVHT